jgi:4-amino-4-deoxy-L-arabinose transferase-like glycosyltransferase
VTKGAGEESSFRFAPALLISLMAWEFCVLLANARNRLFWYDELITFRLSRLPSLPVLEKALQAGSDSMPLGYYMIVRLAGAIPGNPLITLRLPSVAGYFLALLGVYWFVSKRFSQTAGLVAAILISLTPFRAYAIEARSYALLVGFVALAAALWQRIGEVRFASLFFGLALLLAVASHPFAVLIVAAFGLAELSRFAGCRDIRWRVWIACVVATLPFVLNLGTLLRLRTLYSAHFWSLLSWRTVFDTYDDYLGLHSGLTAALVALLVALCAGLARRLWNQKSQSSLSALPEVVLISCLLLYPAFLFAITKLGHSGYTARYGWPGILGLVLASVFALGTFMPASLLPRLLGAALIAFAFQGGVDIVTLLKLHRSEAKTRWPGLIAVAAAEPGLPIVVADGMKYLEYTEYGPPRLQSRTVNLNDAALAVRLIGIDTIDKTNRALAGFAPLNLEAPAAFLEANSRFILQVGGGYDWLMAHLLENQYHLTFFSQDNDGSLYLAEKTKKP